MRVRHILVIALVVIALLVAACQPNGGSSSSGQVVEVERGTVVSTVSAIGSVTPLISANLAFKTSGTVEEIYVEVGNRVTEGQPLAKLETTALELQVAQAEAQLASAQASLDDLFDGPTAAEMATAQSALASAYTSLVSNNLALQNLRDLYTTYQVLPQQAWSYSAAIEAAEAAIETAQARIDELEAGPTEIEVAIAEANVAYYQAAFDLANYNLECATLVAPFDGVVGDIPINVGEIVSTIITAVTLINPRVVRAEVNVDELDIVPVELGQEVELSFDAIPGRVYSGVIIRIAPSATEITGVPTYLVTITINETTGIKPGMSVDADIIYASAEDVLMVPNRAVETMGQGKVVKVLVNGQVQQRTVQTGIVGDQFTEILNGLDEGEQVVI